MEKSEGCTYCPSLAWTASGLCRNCERCFEAGWLAARKHTTEKFPHNDIKREARSSST